MAAFYHDDPIEETPPPRRKVPGILASVLLLFATALFFKTTLAANISISTGLPVEFGQGVAVTAACAGSSTLTMTPAATFVNSSGGGAHYFSSVTVSGIPSSCNGVDFAISAYNNTGSALAIFNTSSTSATIWSNAGTFQGGLGSSGTTVTSGSGTFTVIFAAPVALASNVAKMTLQSGPHSALDCSSGGTCALGNTGPGGGTVFYINASGFNCGPTAAATCRYLEVAPALWNVSGDVYMPAAIPSKQSTSVNPANGLTADATANYTVTGIGLGYLNSRNIVNQGNGPTSAAGLARAYTGAGLSDWFLPDYAEITQLCKYISGQSGTPDATRCLGNNASPLGLSPGSYWSSSEKDASNSWVLNFSTTYAGGDYANAKSATVSVRPIRSF